MTAWNIFLVVYCVVCILPVVFVGVLLSTEEYQKHHSVLVLLLHLLRRNRSCLDTNIIWGENSV